MRTRYIRFLKERRLIMNYMVIIVSSLFLVGCLSLSERSPKEVRNRLKAKYGVEFKVSSLDSETSSFGFDVWPIWEMYPAKNPEIVFSTGTNGGENFIETYYSERIHSIMNKDLVDDNIVCNFLNLPLIYKLDVFPEETFVAYYLENGYFPESNFNNWRVQLHYYIFVPDNYSKEECATTILKTIEVLKNAGISKAEINCTIYGESTRKETVEFYESEHSLKTNHVGIEDKSEDYWRKQHEPKLIFNNMLLDYKLNNQDDLAQITDIEDIYWLEQEVDNDESDASIAFSNIDESQINSEFFEEFLSKWYSRKIEVRSFNIYHDSAYVVKGYQPDTEILFEREFYFSENGNFIIKSADNFLTQYYFKDISSKCNDELVNLNLDLIFTNYDVSISDNFEFKLPPGPLPSIEEISNYGASTWSSTEIGFFMDEKANETTRIEMAHTIFNNLKKYNSEASLTITIYNSKYIEDVNKATSQFGSRPFLNNNIDDEKVMGRYTQSTPDEEEMEKWILTKIVIPSNFVSKIDSIDDLYKLIAVPK